MNRHFTALLLVLALVLAACGANDTDNRTGVDDTGTQDDTSVVVDDMTTPDATSTETDPGYPAAQGDASTETEPGYPAPQGDDNADDTAQTSDDSAQTGATDAYPAPGSGTDTDLVSRLAEFNIPLPPGAQGVAVDDQGESELEATFQVPGMAGDAVIGFFQESLTASGYEIEELESDKIEFRNDLRSGEIEIEQGNDPARFKIEVEPR